MTAEVLWEPSQDRVDRSRLTAFVRHVGRADDTYEPLWQCSVDELAEFWARAWSFFDGVASRPYDEVVSSRTMPDARWFAGAWLNLAENVLRPEHEGVALVALGETGPAREVSWDELRGLVGAFQSTLDRFGVRRGDRVVATLPNGVEAVVAMLACAAQGAVWSTCAPDIGPASAQDRFGQLDPVVLIAADGYVFHGVERDRREAVAHLTVGLPSLRHVVLVPVLGAQARGDGAAVDRVEIARVPHLFWAAATAEPQPPTYAQLEAEAPLWVAYSSGTTGLPKGLVHSHAGALLMGLSQSVLQSDLGPGDRYLWWTTTSWIMWNSQISALGAGATVVLYDGSPLHPSPDRLWQVTAEQQVTCLGVSPGFLLACEKAGSRAGHRPRPVCPDRGGVTGSPLPAASFRWIYAHVASELPMHVISGGTDFAGALVGDAPWLPVTAGEMSCRGLGIRAESWDEAEPARDEVGELVVLGPMPSMPLRIWGDDGTRYHETYCAVYPRVWRHGDWVTLTSRGTAVVHGRSDSTLNRHGVRMGSADLYAAVEAVPEVVESLVLGVEQADGGYWLPLFVRLTPGTELDDALVTRLKNAVRDNASPRHVPDEVIAVPAIPHTRTGKKLEVPLKRIAQGVAVEKALNLGAVDDPAAVTWFADFFARRT